MKKKKLLALGLVAGLVASMMAPATVSAALEDFNIVTTAEDTKVILDTDMGYFGDDTWCLYTLVQADAAGYIDLIGVTSVGGNVLIAPGTNAILNQLEVAERTDIPVYMGTDIPIMGFRDIEAEASFVGGVGWAGGYYQVPNYIAPDQYHNLGELAEEGWENSETDPQLDMTAAEYMVKAVKENPGQITIMAIGACTNVALACKLDQTFAENTAGIIYMGGSVDVPGNSNACGELNWFYDPEAVHICLTSDFPSQIVVPNDIATNVPLKLDVFEKLEANNNTAISQLLLDNMYDYYKENPDMEMPCWDPTTAAVLLCPDLITETDNRDMAIDTISSGYSYANSVTWETGTGPAKSTNVQIVYNLDRDGFWTLVTDLLGTQF